MQGIAYTFEEIDAFKRNIISWIEESVYGTLTSAADKFGLHKSIVYNWMNADPKFKEDLRNARVQAKDTGLDLAETKLMQAINEGNTAELLFFLKTQGKQRGYIERSEIDYKELKPPVIIDDVDSILDENQ
jgi:hypothetical protein